MTNRTAISHLWRIIGRTLVVGPALVLLCALASCSPSTGPGGGTDRSVLDVPPHFPPVPVPEDNPVTAARVALGRHLFYDPRLSLDSTVSCASCHRQEFAFTDGRAISRGVNNEYGIRNTPTLVNTAYLRTLSYDGRSSSIEEQSLRAVLNPMEMRADTAVVSQMLRSAPEYAPLFAEAFGPGTPDTRNAMRAIASFVRTMLSGSSRYDRFLQGDTSALDAAEHRGRRLFFSKRTRCASCHKGHDFTDGAFHNTGLYMHYIDKGYYYTTSDNSDVGRFKTPSLRNITLTAPYMHDGKLPTLDDVMEHYLRGGHPNLQRDTLMRPLDLTPQETADLVRFLHTLTDENLVRDARFGKPE